MFIFATDEELWPHKVMDHIMSCDHSLSQKDILKFVYCFMIIFLTIYIFKHFLLYVPVSVFCTGKIYGGQDRAFLFWGGLVNYKTHYSLSWFRPILEGNNPTSSGLILKMNNDYNWVSRELKKFAKWREKCSRASWLKCRGAFYRPRDGWITTS
jgi:hypothetical protein